MDVIPSPVEMQIALVFLDNIVVILVLPFEYGEHGRSNFSLLQDEGAALKLKKCVWFTGTTEYLGRVRQSRRLEITTHTTDAI